MAFAATAALGQNPSSGANEAMEFSRILSSPVTTAIGFSGKARTGDIAWASGVNAAMIPFSEEVFGASSSYQLWNPLYDPQNAVSVGLGARWGIFGVSGSVAFRVGSSDIYESFDDDGLSQGMVTRQPLDAVANLGLGVQVLPFLSVGVDLRYSGSRLSDKLTPLVAFGADIFVAARYQGFNFSAGVANLGPKVTAASGDRYPIPTSLALAAGYENSFGDHGAGAWLDLDYFTAYQGFTAAAGAEYSWRRTLFARAGYHFATAGACLPSFATFGLGGRYRDLSLDASILLFSPVSSSFTVGITYSF